MQFLYCNKKYNILGNLLKFKLINKKTENYRLFYIIK